MTELTVTFPHATTRFRIKTDNISLICFLQTYYNQTTDNAALSTFNIEYKSASMLLNLDGKESIVHTDFIIEKIASYIRENIQFEKDWLALHGSVVVINGIPMMFLGKTGTGKTTLVSFLNCFGCPIVCEDLSIINIRTLEVANIKRPLALREAGYRLLRETYACAIECSGRTYNDKLICHNAHFVPVDSKCFVKYFFLLERIPQTTMLTSLEPSEVLLYNSYLYHDIAQIYLKTSVLKSKICIRKLIYNDLHKALELLRIIAEKDKNDK